MQREGLCRIVFAEFSQRQMHTIARIAMINTSINTLEAICGIG
jgi:hypothetical protein